MPLRASTMMLYVRRCAALLLFFAVGCSRPTEPTPVLSSKGEWHTFEGTWSASGTRQTMYLEGNHRASIFDLSGSLLVTGDRGMGVGFRAKTIGLSDSLSGMQGRCVWTDERGDKIFSTIKGEWVGAGNRISGTFLGGTGRFADVTGEYSFQWEYVVESDDATLSGRAVDLKGKARFGDATAAPHRENSP